MRRSSDTPAPALGVLLAALLAGCGGDKVRNGDAAVKETESAGEEKDTWLELYGDYFTPEFREVYLATPADERFRVHGETLIDFFQRVELLDRIQGELTPEQLDQYHRLPTLEACREYLRPYMRDRE